MKKIFLFSLLLTFYFIKPSFADDLKCSITYEFFEKTGENRKTIKLNKDGSKYKLVLKEKAGTPDEKTTTAYIYQDQAMVYTVIDSRGIKIGTKQALETMLVGMQWGIYFLNFPKASDFTSVTSSGGSETIISKDCTIKELRADPLVTKYYFWNDIMLRKTVNDGVSGYNTVTEQATSIDENPVFSPGEFDYPQDVQYY